MIVVFALVSCSVSRPPDIVLSSSNYQVEIEHLQKGLDSTLVFLETHGARFGLDQPDVF